MKEATKHEASLIRDGVMDDDTCLVVSAADYDALRQQLADVSNERDGLRAALTFYAEREHYHFESGNWDTVSGEPLNILWCGDEPDFVEDGTVARNALCKSTEQKAQS